MMLRHAPLLALLLAACHGSGTATSDSGTAAPDSVKPGINDSFLEAESADPWVARFESESREIAAQRDPIVTALALQPGQRVADVGAGTGLFLEPLAAAVGEDGAVVAVDLAPVMVGQLLRRKKALGLSQVEVVQCTESSVELPEQSVDMVFVCDTYHHFEYPGETLASIHRALRPGGSLVIVDFHRIAGQSREWVMGHVRAGEEVFRAEIEAAGFEQSERRTDLLMENYFLRFRRIEP